jgi:hypothetical protein
MGRTSYCKGEKEVSFNLLVDRFLKHLEQEFNSITTADQSEENIQLQKRVESQRLEIEELQTQLSGINNSDSISHI